MIKSYNSDNGKIINSSLIYEDFGDFAPFLHYYDKHKIVKDEFHLLKKILKKEKIYHKKRAGFLNLFTFAYDQTDLMYGLLYVLNLYPTDKEIKTTTKNIIDNCLKCFSKDNKQYMAVTRRFKFKTPIFSAIDN